MLAGDFHLRFSQDRKEKLVIDTITQEWELTAVVLLGRHLVCMEESRVLSRGRSSVVRNIVARSPNP